MEVTSKVLQRAGVTLSRLTRPPIAFCRGISAVPLAQAAASRRAILLGDEIVVRSARVGRVKEVIKVDLPRPRSLDVVKSLEFGTLFDRAFHLIREEVAKTMNEQAEIA
jgi:hypothetical protein